MKKSLLLLILSCCCYYGFSQCGSDPYLNLYNTERGIISADFYPTTIGGTYTLEYGPSGYTTPEGVETGDAESYHNFQFEGLALETSYEFNLTITCPDEGASGQVSKTITTLSECPAPLYGISLYNRDPGVVLVSYSTLNRGGTYYLEYGPEGFVTPDGSESGNISDDYVSVEISGLDLETVYEFRLVENCESGGVTPEVSSTITTLSECPAPEYGISLNNSGVGSVNVTYRSFNVGGTYTLRYGPENFTTASGEATGDIDREYMDINISGLENETLYEFRLVENCTNGDLTPEVSSTVTTLSGCPDPYGFYLSKSGKGAVSASLNSYNIGGAYTVEYGPEGFVTPEGSVSGDITEDDMRIQITDLQDETTYEFRLVVQCSNGDFTSEVTSTITTLEACPEPSYISANNDGKNTVEVQWNSYNPNGVYTLQYGPEGFTTPEGELTGDINVSYAYVEVTGLTAETTYEFRIVETCTNGDNTAEVSATVTTVGACPEPEYLHVGNISVGAVEVDWDSFNEGGTYTLQYGPEGFTTPEGELTGNILNDYIELEVTGLSVETNYEFRIFETCTNGDNTGTVTRTLETASECPDPRSLYFDEEAVGALELEWNSLNMGQVYTISYERTDIAGGPYEISGTINDRYMNVEVDVEPSASYEFAITESCANGGNTDPLVGQYITMESCPVPEWDVWNDDIFVSGSEVVLYFESYNIGETYTIEYGPAGFTRGSGDEVTGIVEDSYSVVGVDGLSPESSYDFYLSVSCDGGSAVNPNKVSITTTTDVPEPANSDCANAVSLSMGDNNGTTTGIAGFERPESCQYVNLNSRGVWYTYTATANTNIKFDLCNETNEFDSQLEIFTGSCGDLTCVAGEDDDENCDGSDPIITIPVTNGTTYYLYVSGYSYDDFGSFVLNVSEDAAYVPCAEISADPVISSVTSGSADISWSLNSAGSYGYLYVYEQGTDIYNGEAVVSESFPSDEAIRSTTITGLDAGTEYEAYVMEECEDSEDLIIEGPFSFTISPGLGLSSTVTDNIYISNNGIIKIHGIDNLTSDMIHLHTVLGKKVNFVLSGNEVTVSNNYKGILILSLEAGDRIINSKVLKN